MPALSLIFEQGEPAIGFYLIRTGTVKIYKVSPDGREQVLGVFQAGQSFAEAAVFNGGGYPASAQTLQDSDLLYVSRDLLLQEIQRNPELAFRLLAGVSMKLRSMVALIEDLTLRDARGRVCRYITNLIPEDEAPPLDIHLPFSQAVLARMLGITAETLSRTFKGLSDDGVLETSRQGKLVIIKPEVLFELVGSVD